MSNYANYRQAGREHFPQTPKGFIALRIVQLVLAVTVLGLDAYTLSIVLFDSSELTIFTSVATLIVCVYYLVVEFGQDAWSGYNYWAVLSLDVFLLIFWLISFALSAARVAPYAYGWVCDDIGDCLILGDTVFACMCTVAGLGGIEFALFIVSTAIHSVAVHRHRAAGLHCRPVPDHERGQFDNGPNNNSIPMQSEKQRQQQQQQQQQQPAQNSLYAPSQPSITPQPGPGPYSPPPPPASTVSPQQQQQLYYPPQQQPQQPQQQQQQQQQHQHQQQPMVSSFGGPVPTPHSGTYEAPGQGMNIFPQ